VGKYANVIIGVEGTPRHEIDLIADRIKRLKQMVKEQ